MGKRGGGYHWHTDLPQIRNIPVPHDIHELQFVPDLIDKIPLYISKMKEVESQLDSLAKKVCASDDSCQLNYYALKDLIYKSFFIDLENRKYNNYENESKCNMSGFDYEYRNVRWGQIISDRNAPCEVCGENRVTDQCHIIPRKLGGSFNADNILILCPTHHRLLDRFMLSREEYASINWSLKSEPSQYYAENVTLKKHQKFWEQVEGGHYAPIPFYEQASDEWVIFEYTLNIIMNCFMYKDVVGKDSILGVLDNNVKSIGESLMKYLIEQGYCLSDSKKVFLTLIERNFDYKELARRCWSATCF